MVSQSPQTAPNAAHWRKSSYSAYQTACVEAADWANGAAVRDSKHRDLGALVFPSSEWQAFLEAVKIRGF